VRPPLGIKAFWRLLHSCHDDIWWQQAGQSVSESVGWVPELCAQARHLAEGMNAGIGATRTGDVDRLSDDPGHGLFQGSLDGGHPRLDLPTMIIGPVILDR
jgi:hypothetical protein